MGIKLNPPIVEGKTIAQALERVGTNLASTQTITIPFTMNKSVGFGDFESISLILKTVHSNHEITTVTCNKNTLKFKQGQYFASFNIKYNFLPGQYYKAQLAYVTTDKTVGFYSNVTVFKTTETPLISIQGLASNEINMHFYNYTGVYENRDATEKVYTYEFNLYDSFNKLVASSGELLHNSSTDTESTWSMDMWSTRYGLTNGIYTIQYKIKTINGLESSSISYKLIDNQTTDLDLSQYWTIQAKNNEDSGSVALVLEPKDSVSPLKKKFLSGQFVLLRAASDENFNYWNEITRFNLIAADSTKEKLIYTDYCVTQGVSYKYAIQSYNNQNMYSNRLVSNLLTVDFEDMFLSDGERQLRIRFNPAVSSIKNTILESKIDTLGGKYPFFFRNKNLNYKEFPIAGLISVLMDQNGEFVPQLSVVSNSQRLSTPSNINWQQGLSTDLIGENFKKERDFKHEVLNWLTNGQPKQFRSPSEGNYLVRLMNVTLSPDDTLGRMLHSFNCNAYEIDDYNFTNLQKYNMLINSKQATTYLQFFSQDINSSTLLNFTSTPIDSMVVIHATPGSQIKYTLSDDTIVNITINYSGQYFIDEDILTNNPLVKIQLNKGSWNAIFYSITQSIKQNYISQVRPLKELCENKNIIIGTGESVLNTLISDEKKYLYSLGQIETLEIEKRAIEKIVNDFSSVEEEQRYVDDYDASNNEILLINNTYYDAVTKENLGSELDYQIQLRENEVEKQLDNFISYENEFLKNCTIIEANKNKIKLANINNMDTLSVGKGLKINKIQYTKMKNIYTETDAMEQDLIDLKQKWESNDGTDAEEEYEVELEKYLTSQEALMINTLEKEV